MRFYLGVLISTLVGVGCSHAPTSDSSHPSTQPPAATVKATENPAPAAPAQSAKRMECSVGGDVRVLEVRAHGAGCELAYTKAGKEGIVASSEHGGMIYCEKASDRIHNKLKGAGFDCK